MEPSIDELKKNYERFDDKKLIRIATEEAASLRPEALDLIKQVIKERGLSEDIIKGVDVQLTEIDERTLLSYTELLRKQPCPVCGSSAQKLNASMVSTVISFIIMTNYTNQLKIACPDCLDKQNKDAILKTALFGWWGFPWGIIRTIQALNANRKVKKQIREYDATDLLKGYVLNNVGRIEASKNKPEELQSLTQYIR